MISRAILLLITLGSVLATARAQQPSPPCPEPIPYVGEELRLPLGYDPVKVGAVFGQVRGVMPDGSDAVKSQVCVGLFTEKKKKLIASAITDGEGRYRFGEVPAGSYRLVVRLPGFYVAEIQVRVTSKSRGKLAGNPVDVYLHLPAIHTGG